MKAHPNGTAPRWQQRAYQMAAGNAPSAPAYKQVVCYVCQVPGHKPEAEFCWRCGEKL